MSRKVYDGGEPCEVDYPKQLQQEDSGDGYEQIWSMDDLTTVIDPWQWCSNDAAVISS